MLEGTCLRGDLLLHCSSGWLGVLVCVLHRSGELVVSGRLTLTHGLIGTGIGGARQATALEELVVYD